MPAPDPHAIWYDENPDGSPRITGEVWASSHPWWPGNPRHRKARVNAVARNIARGGWLCAWCLDPVPIHRRADARFCCEGCRKRAARERRR